MLALGTTGTGIRLVEFLLLIEREMLIFALFWFVVGLVDELLVDGIWIVLRCRSQQQTPRVESRLACEPLQGRLAVMVAAWREADVIGSTIATMLDHWRGQDVTLYVGCYCNDPATIAAAMAGAAQDSRLRIILHDRHGPTTKADCLNRLYAALCVDERRMGRAYRGIILHDSEDMVHPLELALVDRALDEVDFVQLPVRPELPAGPHWVAGHYADEFTEAHARMLPVRDILGAGLPAAGVSCGFAREMLHQIAQLRQADGEAGPFAAECLTEDYELGLLITRLGGRSRFLRCRDERGLLIGTRSYFPDTLSGAVRQKTRWIHGISLQGWDRLGWGRRWVEKWMTLRDRRGPLTALVLFTGYALLMLDAALQGLRWQLGAAMPQLAYPSALRWGLMLCGMGMVWRAAMRFTFTTREYGWREGVRAVLRMPLANVVMIMAARRAVFSYCRTLAGQALVWDKTEHDIHPARKIVGTAP
jgi:adsorption protein B